MEDNVNNTAYHQYRIILLMACFLIPILIYTFWILSQKSNFFITYPDSDLYINIAENLLNGKGLVNTLRPYDIVPPPLYPLLIAAFLYIFNNFVYLVIFQYFLHGFSCVLIFLIAEQLFNDRVGLIAVLLFSINPVLLASGPQFVLMETAYTFALLLIVFFLIRFCSSYKNGENPGLSSLFLMLSLCLAAFIRPHLMTLILPLLLAAVFFVIRKKMSVRWLLVVVLLPVILVSMNTAYNYHMHRKWIPLENYSGMGLYFGNNPNTSEGFYIYTNIRDFIEPYYFTMQADSSIDFTDQNNILRQRAVSYILSDPVEAIARTLRKMINHLYFPQNRLDKFTIYFFMIGGIVSWLLMRDKRLPIGLILMIIIIYSITASLGVPLVPLAESRYRLPIIPVYLIFSSFFFVWAYEFLVGKLIRPLGSKLICLLNQNK